MTNDIKLCFSILLLTAIFFIQTVSALIETIGKCQVQSDNLSPWPEDMPMVIKYQISGTLAGNLRLIVEPFLKMAMDILFLSVVAIFKPLWSNVFYEKG